MIKVAFFFLHGLEEPVVTAFDRIAAMIPNTTQVVTFEDMEGTEYWVPWSTIHRVEVREIQEQEGGEQNGDTESEAGAAEAGGADGADLGEAVPA